MMNQNKYIFWFKLGVGNQSRGFKIPSWDFCCLK
jgi:hypothetical protein